MICLALIGVGALLQHNYRAFAFMQDEDQANDSYIIFKTGEPHHLKTITNSSRATAIKVPSIPPNTVFSASRSKTPQQDSTKRNSGREVYKVLKLTSVPRWYLLAPQLEILFQKLLILFLLCFFPHYTTIKRHPVFLAALKETVVKLLFALQVDLLGIADTQVLVQDPKNPRLPAGLSDLVL